MRYVSSYYTLCSLLLTYHVQTARDRRTLKTPQQPRAVFDFLEADDFLWTVEGSNELFYSNRPSVILVIRGSRKAGTSRYVVMYYALCSL